MNLSNKITILRIALIPVFMVFLLTGIRIHYISKYNPIIAVAIFCFAALTDTVDGYIARRRKEVTTFGILMDPIADKLLISAAILALVQLDRLSAWVAMVIISRDFAVSGLRSLAAAKNIIISATIWGKLKTITQIVAIVATILNLPIVIFGGKIETILMFIAVVITIISGFDYFIKARDVFNKNDIDAGGE